MSAKNKVYTAQEVADLLRIPKTEVYRAAKHGDIPGRIRVGGRTRFAAAAIDAFVDGQPNDRRS